MYRDTITAKIRNENILATFNSMNVTIVSNAMKVRRAELKINLGSKMIISPQASFIKIVDKSRCMIANINMARAKLLIRFSSAFNERNGKAITDDRVINVIGT